MYGRTDQGGNELERSKRCECVSVASVRECDRQALGGSAGWRYIQQVGTVR